jgi:alpha-galactosidase
MWRTTGDINDSWESMDHIGFGQDGLQAYAGPNHWNDPDMLIVGMHGHGNVAHGGCSDSEYRVHFSLWCLLASPLMIGCDVRKMDDATRTILTNPRVIAVNQDPLGRQGFRAGSGADTAQVWMKPMADGSVVAGLFNRHDRDARKITAAWEALGLHDRRACRLQDLWSGADLGEFRASFTAVVPPHDVALVRITPTR